jgi:hypothetical protein
MKTKNIQFEYYDPTQCTFSQPLYILDRELMYSDHLHAGFYVSCTSADIRRVQSWSIAKFAFCD